MSNSFFKPNYTLHDFKDAEVSWRNGLVFKENLKKICEKPSIIGRERENVGDAIKLIFRSKPSNINVAENPEGIENSANSSISILFDDNFSLCKEGMKNVIILRKVKIVLFVEKESEVVEIGNMVMGHKGTKIRDVDEDGPVSLEMECEFTLMSKQEFYFNFLGII